MLLFNSLRSALRTQETLEHAGTDSTTLRLGEDWATAICYPRLHDFGADVAVLYERCGCKSYLETRSTAHSLPELGKQYSIYIVVKDDEKHACAKFYDILSPSATRDVKQIQQLTLIQKDNYNLQVSSERSKQSHAKINSRTIYSSI